MAAEIVLILVLIISILRGQAYKASLKAMSIYMQKKGYTLPNDSELKECSQTAIKQMFRLKVK